MAFRRQKSTSSRPPTAAAALLAWSRSRMVPAAHLAHDDPDVRRLAAATQEAVVDYRRLIMLDDDDLGRRSRAIASVYAGLAGARRAFAQPRGLPWVDPTRR